MVRVSLRITDGRCTRAWVWLLCCACSILPAAPSSCQDETSCAVRLGQIMERLTDTSQAIKSGQMAADAVGTVRSKLTKGIRFELPTAQREHLMKESPIFSEVAFDLKHRPVSTTFAKHFKHVNTIEVDSTARLHALVSLKQATDESISGVNALIATIDADSRLWVHSVDGDVLVSRFDLGHLPGYSVTTLAISPRPESRYILTVDDYGLVRVHNLQVKLKSETATKAGLANDSEDGEKRKKLIATVSFSTGFKLSIDAGGTRKLTTVLTLDHDGKQYVIVGDSVGALSVFTRSGTVKARVRVTSDAGGIKGLLRAEGQTVVVYTASSFSFFSLETMDVLYPPCKGWSAQLVSIAEDPRNSYPEVIMSLSTGDVVVYTTPTEKDRDCRFVMKFPRVSLYPFELRMFQGYAVGLPLPPNGTNLDGGGPARELYFFNVEDMRNGVGEAHTRTITVQARFRPLQPCSFAMLPTVTHKSKRAVGQFAIQFEGSPAIGLYNVSIKMAPSGVSWLPDGPPWWPLLLKIGAVLLMLASLLLLWLRKRRKRFAAEESAKTEAEEKAKAEAEGQDGDDQDDRPNIEEVFDDQD